MTSTLPPEVRQALERGWSVLPTGADKKPCLSSWKALQRRRPTAAEATRWQAQYQPAAWAVVTGTISNLAILDFDGEAGVALLQRLQLHPHVKTGSGGFHVYVEHPGWPVPTLNSKAKREFGQRYPGLDIRGDGGYALFCGQNQQGTYAWLRDMTPDPVTVLPPELRQYLGLERPGVPTRGDRVPADILLKRALDRAHDDGRNNAGVWLFCQLRDNDYDQGEVEAIAPRYVSQVHDTNVKGHPEPYSLTEALASVRQVFTRPAREPWASSQKSSVPPSDSEAEGEREHFTELGNARRLVRRHGQDLCYCHQWDKWLVWDSTRWIPDDTGDVTRYAEETICALYAEAATIADSAERKELVSYARKQESAAKFRAMVTLAQHQPGIPVRPEELDTDPWLLNCANGTLDLKTGTLHPHRREDLCTKLVPVAYDPQAQCPTWLAFLQRILAGNQRLMGFLQRAVGYALAGDTSEQCLFLLYGTGANGKTTLLETLQSLLGDYAKKADSSTFLLHQHDAIRNDIAALVGARLVTAEEIGEGRRLAEVLVKQLTGGDRVTARFLFREPFEFKPVFKIFLAANHKPVIRGTDYAIWRRIRLIPFTVTIPKGEQDKKLPSKLLAELPGILRWAVEGCLAWQHDGLGEPAEVLEATEEYRSDMDVLGGFLAECCTLAPGAGATAKQLYTAYTQWVEQNGEEALSQRAFGMRLSERGLTRRRGTGNVHSWLGIGLSDPSDPSDPNFGLLETNSNLRGKFPEKESQGSLGSPPPAELRERGKI